MYFCNTWKNNIIKIVTFRLPENLRNYCSIHIPILVYSLGVYAELIVLCIFHFIYKRRIEKKKFNALTSNILHMTDNIYRHNTK